MATTTQGLIIVVSLLAGVCLDFHTLWQSACASEIVAVETTDSVVDPSALTIDGGFGQSINGKSFQQNPLVSHKGWQYIAFYDKDRHVCVGRRELSDGEWEIARFLDYDFKSNDAHNTISMGVCPRDGTIHLAFDHHGHPLHYRVSKQGVATNPKQAEWSVDQFGPIVSELESGKPIRITYPRFWQTPEGNLQFGYRRGRSGNGDRMLVDYDGKSGKWKNTRQIDSGKGAYSDEFSKLSKSRCSYPNGYGYGPDGKLHATWVWREGGGSANHDLMYAYSEDQGITWRNNQGEPLSEPASVDSPGITVAKISLGYGLLNTHGQAVDSQGRIHTIMKHCSDESLRAAGSRPGELRWGPLKARRYHHYWRADDGVWSHTEIEGTAGNRPKLFFDKNDNAYFICTDAPSSKNIHPTQGNLKIMTATAKSKWNDWRLIHTEQGPFVNEAHGDPIRWKEENVLSVMVQELPTEKHAPSRLRVVDFRFGAN